MSWNKAEKAIHEPGKQAIALAGKPMRIEWTCACPCNNVRERLRFRNQDCRFGTAAA